MSDACPFPMPLLDLRADLLRGAAPALRPLRPAEARVWWMPVPPPEETGPSDTEGGLPDHPVWSRLEALVSEDELERAWRFRFARDRMTYVAAHALGRLMLSQATGLPTDHWRFTVEAHGKPEVISPDGGPRLRLNLSHTHGMVAAALTETADIGIDVEHFDRSSDIGLVARRVFAEDECAVIFAGAESGHLPRFLRFWTLKEAYVKAIGKGLAQPLKRISFDLGDRSLPPRMRLDGATDPAPEWQFRQVLPGPGHVLALARETVDPAAPVTLSEVTLGL